MQHIPDCHATHKHLCRHSDGRAVRGNTNLCDPSPQATHNRVCCSPRFPLHLSYSLQNGGLTTEHFSTSLIASAPFYVDVCMTSSVEQKQLYLQNIIFELNLNLAKQ